MKHKMCATVLIAGMTAGIGLSEQRPFTLDQNAYSTYINEFWNRFGVCENANGVLGENAGKGGLGYTDMPPTNSAGSPYHNGITGSAGMAEKFAWTDYKGMWPTAQTSSWRTQLMLDLQDANQHHVTGVDGTRENTADKGGHYSVNGYLWLTKNGIPWKGECTHYDQLPNYVNACRDVYMWTGDTDFLTVVMLRVETIMDFMTSHMVNGLFTLSNISSQDGTFSDNGHDGTSVPEWANYTTGVAASHGKPSNIHDTWRSGYQDGWINAAFYTALQSAADLENAFADKNLDGNPAFHRTKAANYLSKVGAVSNGYNSCLWNPGKNRYAGWKDKNGLLHDHGFSYYNLLALANGLGGNYRAHCIFNWLDTKLAETPTKNGAHPGSLDIYQLVIAPRSATEEIPAQDFDDWSSQGLSDPSVADDYSDGYDGDFSDRRNDCLGTTGEWYGKRSQDGGTAFWLVYFDTMARLRWLDADNAYKRLTTLLLRAGHDPRCMTVSESNPFNSYGERKGEIDTGASAGNAVLPMLYGFMGVSAQINGLYIQPNFPSTLFSASCADVNYRGNNKTITVARGKKVQAVEPLWSGTAWAACPQSRTFTVPAAGGSFNEVHVWLKTAAANVTCDITLYKQLTDGTFAKVATGKRLLDEEAWVYLPCPAQQSGATYKIEVSNVSGGTVFWKTDALNNKSYRAVCCSYTSVKDTTATAGSDTCDSCTAGGSLSQLFNTTVPFSKVSIKPGTWANQVSGFTLVLERKILGTWRTMATATYRNLKENWTEMLFADQMAGEYRLTMKDFTGTKIGWYRRYNVTGLSGASNNGITVAGSYFLRIYRGKYEISVGAAAPVLKDAGTAYIYNP